MQLDSFREVCIYTCGLNPDQPLVVGLSGGPDSLCLWDALLRCGFNVTAAHFDHHLRAASTAQAEQVRCQVQKRGAAFALGSADVAALAAQKHLSIEEAARKARYHFLFETAQRLGAQAVAVGHTADDQVETVLMHLLRGAGLDGLAGMPYHTSAHGWPADVPLVRPLLGVRRVETVAWCQERGLEALHDESNENVIFLRNRVRRELIPALETYNPQVRQRLATLAQTLQGDAALLAALEADAWKTCQGDFRQGEARWERRTFLAQPLALQRRLVRYAASFLRPGLPNIDFADVERALAFARQPSRSRQMNWLAGLDLGWREPFLTLGEQHSRAGLETWPQVEGEAPGWLALPGCLGLGAGWRLRAEWLVGADAERQIDREDPYQAWLDVTSLFTAEPERLWVRRAQRGERFQPLGLAEGSIKLSDFWVNVKLPREARAGWPVVGAGEQILWLPGYRPAHAARVKPETRRVLHLCCEFKPNARED